MVNTPGGMSPALTSLASRVAQIEAFQVMEVQRRATELEAAGRSIIHMEIGQPDFSAPPQVERAAIEAIRTKPMSYISALGLPELRAAIAGFYRTRYGFELDPERVIVTAGASGAFLLAMGALVEAGSEVLMADPSYPCNRNFVRMFGATPRCIPVDERQAYQLAPADVETHWNAATRGVLVATPSNPTGTSMPFATLARIVELVRGRGGFVIADEIYHGLQYGTAPPRTALQAAPDVFVVNSFSKYFAMTGWRLGWLVAPPDTIRPIERLAQNAFISVSTPAQYAALAAFTPETLALMEARRVELAARRVALLPRLRELGFSIPLDPDGAFYIYADCSAFAPDSREFALRLLEEAGVALTPGADFGVAQARRYVRIAYTRPLEELEEGVARIRRFLQAG